MKPASKIRVKSLVDRVIGKSLSDRLYVQVCIRRFRIAGVIFVHIPKAAGTSIAKATIGRRAGHFTASQIRATMGDTYNTFFSFTIVRNPYHRLISAYNFAKQGTTSDGAVSNPKIYNGPQFCSFDSFVQEWLVSEDLEMRDLIFRSQTDFVMGPGGPMVDYVGRVENMQEVETVLPKRLGRSIRIGHVNRSQPAAIL